MQPPPEKKRKLWLDNNSNENGDDWGEDDDEFEVLLTQHDHLKQIDHLVASSQMNEMLDNNNAVINKCPGNANVFKQPKSLAANYNAVNRDTNPLQDQLYAKDGEIKNLKMMMSNIEKNLKNQNQQASKLLTEKLSEFEQEKLTLQNEIMALKTQLQFKELELNKNKFSMKNNTHSFNISENKSNTPISTLTHSSSMTTGLSAQLSYSPKLKKTLVVNGFKANNFHNNKNHVEKDFQTNEDLTNERKLSKKSIVISKFHNHKDALVLIDQQQNIDLLKNATLQNDVRYHAANEQGLPLRLSQSPPVLPPSTDIIRLQTSPSNVGLLLNAIETYSSFKSSCHNIKSIRNNKNNNILDVKVLHFFHKAKLKLERFLFLPFSGSIKSKTMDSKLVRQSTNKMNNEHDEQNEVDGGCGSDIVNVVVLLRSLIHELKSKSFDVSTYRQPFIDFVPILVHVLISDQTKHYLDVCVHILDLLISLLNIRNDEESDGGGNDHTFSLLLDLITKGSSILVIVMKENLFGSKDDDNEDANTVTTTSSASSTSPPPLDSSSLTFQLMCSRILPFMTIFYQRMSLLHYMCKSFNSECCLLLVIVQFSMTMRCQHSNDASQLFHQLFLLISYVARDMMNVKYHMTASNNEVDGVPDNINHPYRDKVEQMLMCDCFKKMLREIFSVLEYSLEVLTKQYNYETNLDTTIIGKLVDKDISSYCSIVRQGVQLLNNIFVLGNNFATFKTLLTTFWSTHMSLLINLQRILKIYESNISEYEYNDVLEFFSNVISLEDDQMLKTSSQEVESNH